DVICGAPELQVMVGPDVATDERQQKSAGKSVSLDGTFSMLARIEKSGQNEKECEWCLSHSTRLSEPIR
ncbi:MAG TPA: hypothetical protein VIV66_10055, partial [Pyrinomonadaceae bacterium]